ncbi:MAG: DUF1684 domain-containing protein [Bacteroidota bacterium]|nr:DUF1684 domain-containing protein [Bacteroidota bacterium]
MKKIKCLTAGLLLFSFPGVCQQTYKDSIQAYIKNYTDKHEVVTGDDKKYLNFFPINEHFRTTALFERVKNGKWFTMETSGNLKQVFRVYGIIHFTIHDTALTLNIYQSQRLMNVAEFKDQLFLPFTDLTSGEESYAAGRYIDLVFDDILDNKVVIDFNKAYNPYCAYASGKYNCPIPPRENNLTIAILAGEKNYGKHK